MSGHVFDALLGQALCVVANSEGTGFGFCWYSIVLGDDEMFADGEMFGGGEMIAPTH